MTPRFLGVLIAAVLLLAGCGGAEPAPAAGGKPIVVTTTDVYGAIATAVAGDKAEVHAIITSPDADPHEYESTPADALAVGKAAVLVANGGGYDDFAGRLLETAAAKPLLIDVSKLSGLDTGPDFNEHVWYHLPTVAALSDQIAVALGRAAPADAATFTANAEAFRQRLTGLDAKLTAIRNGHTGAGVAMTEPVPGYLVDAAGLTNLTPPEFTEAVELGNDPPAAVLAQTTALFSPATAATANQGTVRALLTNPQTENAATHQVEDAARAAGVPSVPMTETLPAGTMDYVDWMGGQIDRLAAALDRR
jgi:zinc/manganese transport system substrate-binding protein